MGDDEPGRFEAYETVTGDVSLVVTAWGYAASEIALDDLRLGERRRLEVTLDALGALTVRGACTDALAVEWSGPLEGSFVRAQRPLTIPVDRSGATASTALAPGRYRLRETGTPEREISGRGVDRVELEVVVLPGETCSIDLVNASQVRPGGAPLPDPQVGQGR